MTDVSAFTVFLRKKERRTSESKEKSVQWNMATKKGRMKWKSSRVESSQVDGEHNENTHTQWRKIESYLIFFIFRRTHNTAHSMYTHIMLHIIVSRSDDDDDDDDGTTTAAMMMAKTTTSTITTNNEWWWLRRIVSILIIFSARVHPQTGKKHSIIIVIFSSRLLFALWLLF